MRRRAGSRGYTTVELMVAIFLAFIVVLALGRIILANQRSWEWGRDKAVLQANLTEALEGVSRSVHAARTLEVILHGGVPSEVRTYDETGALVHTFMTATVGTEVRLQRDGTDLVARKCTYFRAIPDNDTTSVTLVLELEDKAGSRVRATTRAAIRNRFFQY